MNKNTLNNPELTVSFEKIALDLGDEYVESTNLKLAKYFRAFCDFCGLDYSKYVSSGKKYAIPVSVADDFKNYMKSHHFYYLSDVISEYTKGFKRYDKYIVLTEKQIRNFFDNVYLKLIVKQTKDSYKHKGKIAMSYSETIYFCNLLEEYYFGNKAQIDEIITKINNDSFKPSGSSEFISNEGKKEILALLTETLKSSLDNLTLKDKIKYELDSDALKCAITLVNGFLFQLISDINKMVVDFSMESLTGFLYRVFLELNETKDIYEMNNNLISKEYITKLLNLVVKEKLEELSGKIHNYNIE